MAGAMTAGSEEVDAAELARLDHASNHSTNFR